MHFLIVVLVLAAMAFVSPSMAVEGERPVGQMTLRSWSIDEGLPQVSVRAIVQTSDGYLWLGTDEGLVRFDGHEFQVFDDANGALPERVVMALLEDLNGALWIGTQSGLLRRSPSGDLVFGTDLGLPADEILSLAESRDGVLVGTSKGAARILGDLVAHIELPGFSELSVVAIAEDSFGRVYLGTEASGVFIQELDGSVEHLTVAEGLSSNRILSLFRDRNGTLWIGGRGGLDRRDVDGSLSTDLRLAGDTVWAVVEDRRGFVWFGTGAGLVRVDGERFERLLEPLSHRIAWALNEDSEGNLWVGTASGGLNRISETPFFALSTDQGLGDDVTWTIDQEADGTMLIGSDGGGLARLRDDLAVELIGVEQGLPHADVLATAVAQGEIWVGTRSGLARIDEQGRSHLEGLTGETVRAVIVDPLWGVLAGSTTTGLWRREEDGWSPLGGDLLAGADIRALLRHEGSLWVATYGRGIIRLDGLDLAFAITEEHGLSDLRVYDLLARSDASVWAGTRGGLCRIERSSAHCLDTTDGLVDRIVHSLIDDGAGRLWLSSNRGLWSLQEASIEAAFAGGSAQLDPRGWSVEDGLPTTELNGASQSSFQDQQGRLWFGTVEGAAVIELDRLDLQQRLIPARIGKVLVGGTPIPESGEIEAGLRDLTIDYTGLSMSSPRSVRFRYRIEGLDPSWREVGSRRTAYYTNVPPGQHRFEVQARREGDVWGPTASIDLRLPPTLLETWWLRLIAALSLGFAITALYHVRVRQLKANESQLQQAVNDRTRQLVGLNRQLEDANQRLQRLAIEDDLTGIANHRRMREFLDREWRRCAREKLRLSVLMIDIDYFKRFNDGAGHLAGDACLRAVAQRLAANVHRPSDLVARYGGEEFVVILGNTDFDAALKVGERLRFEVEALAVDHPAEDLDMVTISIGVSFTEFDEKDDVEHLLSRADEALYDAKIAGRNRVRASGRA